MIAVNRPRRRCSLQDVEGSALLEEPCGPGPLYVGQSGNGRIGNSAVVSKALMMFFD